MLYFVLCWMINVPRVQLQSALQYETPSDDGGMFLQRPADIQLDAQGRLYVVDVALETVFVWHANGKFLTNFGKKGSGPGEFSFMAALAGGPQGYLSAVGDQLYVYDAGSRFMNIFNRDFEFQQRFPFGLERGRAEVLRILANKNVAIYNTSYFADVPYRKVGLYTLEKKELVTLIQIDDNSWYYTKDRKSAVFNVYCATLCMALNQANGELIVGHSEKPELKIYSSQGALQETVRFRIKRVAVDDAAIQEYQDQPGFKRQSFFSAKFPDFKAYYDRVLPLGNDGFLVFLESPLYRNITGSVIGRDGQTLGEFFYKCGEGGRIYGSHGRIFAAVTTHDSGDFQIHELKIGD